MGNLKRVKAQGHASFLEGRSTLDHILTLRTLIEQELFVDRCLYSCFVDFNETFDIVPRDKLSERLQHLGVPLHIQQGVQAMYTTIYAKVQIDRDTHGEAMSDIGVIQVWGQPNHIKIAFDDMKETFLAT